ncbi:MAG TPA: hypothetical protein DHV36_19415 [Desulfobacteraceae bacterium]|nr:hypothetical protein [Desulfobacteraceae bacterium]
MKKIIFGGLAVLFGVTGFSFFFGSFLSILVGAVPILLILGGGLAAYLGYTDWQAEKEDAEHSVTYLEDEPEAAQPKAEATEPDTTEAASSKEDAPVSDGETAFKGNPETMVFHSITCNFATGKKCTEEFTTRDAAVKLGYKPCKVCKP